MTREPDWQADGVALYCGDCLDILPTLSECDSIVTDPPYGISFMGKKWDYDIPSTDIWWEAMRVLKPGGHLLAFAGTRTQHRMAVRIEDAGFFIRDIIAWVYGQGFPKSLDVSKAIDKRGGLDPKIGSRLRFTEWMRTTKMGRGEINRLTGTTMGGHYLTAESQPAIPTRKHFEKLRHSINIPIPDWVEAYVDIAETEAKNMERREVIGTKTGGCFSGCFSDGKRHTIGASVAQEVDITAPATPAAKQWEGWGTALKPAMEMITLAQKPFPTTVAECVMEHGTGGLNIDGCRIGDDVIKTVIVKERTGGTWQGCGLNGDRGNSEHVGRWPANFIHDGDEQVVGLFPQTKGTKSYINKGLSPDSPIYGNNMGTPKGEKSVHYGDAGSVARFFKTIPQSSTEAVDLIICNAKTILEAWKKENANTVETITNPYGKAVVSALNDVAIWASLADKVSSGSLEIITNATPNESKRIVESGIMAMLTIASGLSLDLLQGEHFQNHARVKIAVEKTRTDTTKITINHWKSDGSVDPVIFNITRNNWDRGGRGFGGIGEASRFMYCPKAGKEDRDEGLGGFQPQICGIEALQDNGRGEGFSRNTHPTVKPTALMQYLCRLVTPPGGVVLDPFMGSGSTGKAAVREGFRFIGIERDRASFDIAKARIQHEMGGVPCVK